MKWEQKEIEFLPIDIIDGDRGVNYPKMNEFYENEHCLFLNTGNVTQTGFDFSKCQFINFEKDEKLRKGKLMRNDIVLTTRGTLGNIGYYSDKIPYENIRINSGMVIIRSKNNNEFNPNFIYYSIRESNFQTQIANARSGSAQPQLPIGTLKKLKLFTPPLPIQRKIASILSAYDDLIENNLKRIKLLEEKAFVSYKLLVKSEKLIEGKVGDLADVKSGYAFKSRDWSDEGFPVIKIKNIGNNDIDLTGCSFIPESIAELAHKFKLNAGDLLIAMTGATVGKIGMMPKTETSFYLNQRVGIFKPKVENAELFLFCFFNEPSAKNAVESLASGAAQPNISGSQLESIKLYYPKLDTVTEFGNSIKSHFELIWNLKEQNTKLREARDILLPKLMNGQIEV